MPDRARNSAAQVHKRISLVVVMTTATPRIIGRGRRTDSCHNRANIHAGRRRRRSTPPLSPPAKKTCCRAVDAPRPDQIQAFVKNSCRGVRERPSVKTVQPAKNRACAVARFAAIKTRKRAPTEERSVPAPDELTICHASANIRKGAALSLQGIFHMPGQIAPVVRELPCVSVPSKRAYIS